MTLGAPAGAFGLENGRSLGIARVELGDRRVGRFHEWQHRSIKPHHSRGLRTGHRLFAPIAPGKDGESNCDRDSCGSHMPRHSYYPLVERYRSASWPA